MTSTWAAEEDGGLVSLHDLMAQLDATAAAGREASAIRPDTDPRIPKLEHVIEYDWRPPPSREEVLKTVSADCCRRFNGTTKKAGTEFGKYPPFKPTVVNVWESERCRNAVPERSVKNPPDSAPPRFRFQSEAFGEPKDSQLQQQHRQWLKQHRARRQRHVHPVYEALKRVEACEVKAKEIQLQKEKARDLMTRPALVQPNLTENAKASLHKAKLAIGSKRAFDKLRGVDAVADAEKASFNRLLKAKSDPALEFKQTTPRHHAKHLRSWKGTDRRFAWVQTDRCLRHSTPLLDKDEEHELKSRRPPTRERGAATQTWAERRALQGREGEADRRPPGGDEVAVVEG